MEQAIDVSIIIPAYNEAKRLPRFLESVISFCAAGARRYEIIVVDDGSVDGSSEVALGYRSAFPSLRVIRNDRNRGKGFTVRRGMLEAKGRYRAFLDADGSVEPDEIERNLHYLEERACDLFIGSRALKAEDQVLQVRLYRKVIGRVFSFFVRSFLFDDIRDTQCGFKMLRGEAARDIFGRMRIERFGFDLELIYLARRLGYAVKEGPVSWRHVAGSKVNLFADSIEMFINILQIRLWHR